MNANVVTKITGAAALLLALAPVMASAGTPNPTSAHITERVFNDCPISTVTTVNSYPGSISITDDNLFGCLGFANYHIWRFSTDGVTDAKFDNNASYSFCADVNASGTGECEAGLQVNPWWSVADGFFNIRTTDGEIACFGGRLPFYSFTGSQGLHYVKGTTVHMEIVYTPNGLSSVSPATIEYRYTDGSGLHTSGPLAFDEGNPAEDPPHGLWGELNEAGVGGHFKFFLSQSVQEVANVTWTNICYSNNDVVPVQPTTWGSLKALYNK